MWAIKLQSLLLALPIVFLVVARYAGIGHGFSRHVRSRPETFRTQLRHIIATVTARRIGWNEFSFAFPTPQGGDRAPPRLGLLLQC